MRGRISFWWVTGKLSLLTADSLSRCSLRARTLYPTAQSFPFHARPNHYLVATGFLAMRDQLLSSRALNSLSSRNNFLPCATKFSPFAQELPSSVQPLPFLGGKILCLRNNFRLSRTTSFPGRQNSRFAQQLPSFAQHSLSRVAKPFLCAATSVFAPLNFSS